jgi:ornithine cyclodeaminase
MLATYDARQVHDALPWERLAAALAHAFAHDAATTVPVRHAHALGGDDHLLLMPAWDRRALGVKVVTVIPGAVARGAPTVGASYLLLDRNTGAPRALLDGEALTVRRTAAVSAVAARACARPEARRLLVVGTGTLAPWMVRAHVALRPGVERVQLWGRSPARAEAVAAMLRAEGLPVTAVADLPTAAREAEIVCCATTAQAPVVQGAWLSPGTHLDLVGGFTPAMREVDDAAVCRAHIVVDTWGGALAEAGDLVDPMARGVLPREAVVSDLGAVLRGERPGRPDAAAVTLFKSVGTALADLAAALVVAP